LWAELAEYDEIVMKALNRDPDKRFQTADEFAEALDAAAGKAGIAKTRDVAEVVRSLDAEKLQLERQRVRDAIEILGRAEFAGSQVPMPRDGAAQGSQTYGRGGAPGPEGSVSGMLTDGTPVIVRVTSDSTLLKWLVMLLTVLVFMYAGFLVRQLLGASSRPQAAEAIEAVAPPPAVEAAAAEPARVEQPAVEAAPADP
ncbi:MAG: hypothetical protein O7F08_02825, partial [Deltaproteobacteria bacterium]|nr:hypothetical protein [Deltaproteobacteria bacterium]